MEPNQSYLESVRILGIVLHNPDNAEFIIDRLREQYGARRQHPLLDLRYAAISVMKSYQMDYSLVLVEPQSQESSAVLAAYMEKIENLDEKIRKLDANTVKDTVKNALIAKIRSLENLLDSI